MHSICLKLFNIESKTIQSEIMPYIKRKSKFDPNDEIGAIIWMDIP